MLTIKFKVRVTTQAYPSPNVKTMINRLTIISLKKSMNFNVLGFRVEHNYHYHQYTILENINANLLKTIGEFDRFIQTVQYWKLQNA